MVSGSHLPITFCFLVASCYPTVATSTDSAGGVGEANPAPNETCYAEDVWRRQGWTDYTGAFERCGPELVCRKGHDGCAEYCNIDEECEGFPHRVCDSRTLKCEHGGLFKSSIGADVGAALLFLFISGLALSAGIGGGGLYVPLLMVILGFTVREATGLSQACLSGGSSTALVYNLRQRHPSGNKPMIDYTLVLIMGPNLLIGALVGSTLNASAPSWLILALLMIVLSQSAWKAFSKAITTFRKEQSGEVRGMSTAGDARLSKNSLARLLHLISGKPYRQQHDQDVPGVVVGRPAGSDSSPSASAAESPGAQEMGAAYVVGKPVAAESEAEASGEKPAAGQVLGPVDAEKAGAHHQAQSSSSRECGSSTSATDDARPASAGGGTSAAGASTELGADRVSQQDAAPSAAGDQRQYPRRKLLGFASIWTITVLGILVRGGKGTPGLVQYCSWLYWLVALLVILALASVGFQAARRAVAEAVDKPERAPSVEGELQWTAQTAMSVVRWSLMAGTLAALCGIGGGMVMGPILLDLGFLPQVQSATTATTLFVLSTSTCLAFVVAGTVQVDYVVWLGLATGIGAVFGKALIGYAVKKFRRPSIIMFLLAGIITLSLVVLAISGIIDIVNDIRNDKDMLFHSLCGANED